MIMLQAETHLIFLIHDLNGAFIVDRFGLIRQKLDSFLSGVCGDCRPQQLAIGSEPSCRHRNVWLQLGGRETCWLDGSMLYRTALYLDISAVLLMYGGLPDDD